MGRLLALNIDISCIGAAATARWPRSCRAGRAGCHHISKSNKFLWMHVAGGFSFISFSHARLRQLGALSGIGSFHLNEINGWLYLCRWVSSDHNLRSTNDNCSNVMCAEKNVHKKSKSHKNEAKKNCGLTQNADLTGRKASPHAFPLPFIIYGEFSGRTNSEWRFYAFTFIYGVKFIIG